MRQTARQRLVSSSSGGPRAASEPANQQTTRKTAGQKANNTFLHSGVGPAILAAAANAYYLWNEHWEHWSHMPPLEERVEYSYQNIRVSTRQSFLSETYGLCSK